jgi:hypothetical protein
VRAVLEGYPDLRLTKGRKVLEIRPSIKWDKGNALEFLLESLGEYMCFITHMRKKWSSPSSVTCYALLYFIDKICTILLLLLSLS